MSIFGKEQDALARVTMDLPSHYEIFVMDLNPNHIDEDELEEAMDEAEYGLVRSESVIDEVKVPLKLPEGFILVGMSSPENHDATICYGIVDMSQCR